MSPHRTVTANGAALAVRIDGSPDLPWLVLSNSLATDLSMWDGQIADLTRLRRVLRYDSRGHGASTAPAGPHDLDLLARDVVAIMDQLGIASADILGLSLGGMIALGLGLDYPQRVKTVICCCARAEFPAAAVAAWDERLQLVSAGGMGAITQGTLARWFTEATHRERPEVVSHARRMIVSTSADGYSECVAALKGLDIHRRLPAMQKRVLYVAGQEDAAAPPDAMRAMADVTPAARIETVPRAAHMANMENPASFNAAVCAFLRSGERF